MWLYFVHSYTYLQIYVKTSQRALLSMILVYGPSKDLTKL